MKAKKWILVEPFVGTPAPSNFKLVEEELPPLQTGGNRINYLVITARQRRKVSSRAVLSPSSFSLAVSLIRVDFKCL